MEYIMLKNSDLNVSRICVGGCPMGGYNWGKVSRDELIEVVHKAIDVGINFFDTADVYGLGESEKNLGKALRGKREKAVIATKFGVQRDDKGKTFYDNSPDWIVRAVEGSLKRLGTDYIDLYQVHYRDGKTPISEVVNTLEILKQKGLIRYYGLSNISESDMEEMQKVKGRFISFQNEYSLANREQEKDIIKFSQKLDMSILTWGSLGQGILTGKYDANVQFGKNDRRSREIYKNFHGEKLIKNLQIIRKMQEISREIGKSLPAMAIRWILDYLPNSVVLAGVKRPAQLMDNLSAYGWKLSYDHIQELDAVS